MKKAGIQHLCASIYQIDTMKLRDMEAIQGALVPIRCHGLSMHLREKHVYIFGPTKYGGMEVANFTVSMNSHCWEILLKHLEQNYLKNDSFQNL